MRGTSYGCILNILEDEDMDVSFFVLAVSRVQIQINRMQTQTITIWWPARSPAAGHFCLVIFPPRFTVIWMPIKACFEWHWQI